MIKKEDWDKLSEEKQDELSEEAFSYRQCNRCKDYIHLGEENEDEAEGMYFDTYDFFDCSEEELEEYQKNNNFEIFDSIFCWSCIDKMTKDLEITDETVQENNTISC